jgi:thiol peroxidase
MEERAGAVTFRGGPLTLLGPELRAGDDAPDAALLDGDLNEAKLSDYAGKVRVLLTVPSLDTPVCDTEARRFNEAAAGLGDHVVVLVASMDLPFAQRRWCGAAGVERVVTLSDHRQAALGKAYGVLIKELRLLARAVFVIDPAGKIAYLQLVRETTEEPDYEAALAAAREAGG